MPDPDRILDAAADLVGAGTRPTMSAVADRAGVSRATVYRAFADLPTLTRALVASGRVDAERLLALDPTDRVFDAVGSLLAQRGLAATTIEDVAHLAGVAPVTIYRRFGDRRGLFQAFVAARTPRRLATELPVMATGDLEADLRHIARECLRFLTEQRDLFLLAFSADAEAAALFGDLRQSSTSIRATVARYLASQIPGAGAPEAHAFLGMLLALGWDADGDTVEQRARLAVSIFLRGVLA
jgi:AcrR family transcriptional regulator